MFLLDTNICIDFVDGRSEAARQRVRTQFASGLAISSVTAAELLAAARHSADPVEDRRRIERFIGLVDCLAFDDAAARAYAGMVRDIGVRRRSFDRLIAAHALARGLVLVTSNVKDFADVPGLKVEDWTQ
ncbi:MAG: type II toxin-antitoxin system VapC family toxin [Sphingomonadales bacterium]|nr:type II toxin-antitoxin system VapC family toxin [Sphingomonadales bacterium]